jgi:hypothetical protein
MSFSLVSTASLLQAYSTVQYCMRLEDLLTEEDVQPSGCTGYLVPARNPCDHACIIYFPGDMEICIVPFSGVFGGLNSVQV